MATRFEQRRVSVAIGCDSIALLKGAHCRAKRVADLAVHLADVIAQLLEFCLHSPDLSFTEWKVVGRPLCDETAGPLHRIAQQNHG